MNSWVRELDKAALEVEFYEGEFTKEEYMGRMLPEDCLEPLSGQMVRP